MSAEVGRLLFSAVSVFTLAATGRQRVVQMRYFAAPDGAMTIESEYDGRPAPPRVIPPEPATAIRRNIEDDGTPPDGCRLAEIVGLDGKPVLTPVQEAMRRALARKVG